MYYFLLDLHELLLFECLLGLRLSDAERARSTELHCRAPRPLVLGSLEKLLAEERAAATKSNQNVLGMHNGKVVPWQQTQQVWPAHVHSVLPP